MSKPTKFRITPALTTVLGVFVLLTAGAVFLVQAVVSRDVVRELGGQLIDAGMDGLEAAIAEQLYSIRKTASYTARALDTEAVSLDDPVSLESYLFGALAPLDQVSFALIVDATGNGIRVDRGGGAGSLLSEEVSLDLDEPLVSPVFDRAKNTFSPFWSDPMFIPRRDNTYLLYVKPLHEAGTYLGTIILGMSLHRMSEITRHLSDDDITVFLMQVGTTEIIAHPELSHHFADLHPENILVDVDDVPDLFLAGFTKLKKVGNRAFDLNPRDALYSGYDETGEKRFLVLEDRNRSFRGLPVRVGVHFRAEYLEHSVNELTGAAATGLGLLGLSLLGAGLLARRISVPVKRASIAANEVAGLNLGDVRDLPPSSIRELDDLARGFNAMVSGLKAFNRYVPTSLVKRLIQEGRTETPPQEREVAVLFTDIVGFTSLSEGLTATETANFINHHLSLLGAEITKENGTIDKYIGDAVMAFWGAPETLDNPAASAARAALGIAKVLKDDNSQRISRGETPVRIRIGIHLGPLVVGDIGAPERVNYTVIGDTVNIAARLESLGRDIDPDADIIITVSKEVADRLPQTMLVDQIGNQKVKGRDNPVEVVRLWSENQV
ncbi:adenylate/guanylate cyclase domain-containing protein [Labrenzia sp. PHM005]|nr:adenylate/guanylate cyclase domain-containing protein [Labrenzia sp. PHM005]